MTTTVFSSSVICNGTDPIFSYAASGDSLIVNAGVTLSTPGFAVYAPGTGLTDLHATINGTLSASTAIYAYGSSVDLTMGSTGRLESLGAAFEASYDSSVANHGVIHGGEGIILDDVATSTVENWGSIFGGNVGVAFLNTASTGSATLKNHGTLEGVTEAAFSTVSTTLLTNDGTMLANRAGFRVEGFDGDATDAATIDNSGTIQSERDYGIVAHSATVHITNDGTIAGRKGSIYLSSSGADTVTNDGELFGRARLGGGDDIYHGENGRVFGAVWGHGGNDLLVGGAFADVLDGSSGNDTVTGGAGADRLNGSTGADRLSGGTGDDVFRFATAGESVGDAIVASGGATAFAGAGAAWGDRIDVSAIDADATIAGNQQFVFGTSHEIGRLWTVDVGNVTHIRGNVVGGAAPEFDLAINDGAGVHASDYAGIDFIL